ncbi:MAG: hemolysin III family protein [Gammaproteobacteria bacterium]|nr:hemolysin III family protein [Gammaproteobacteria bacterium]
MRVFVKCNHLHENCTHKWFRIEEVSNGITHFIGLLLSIVALVLLVVRSSELGSARTIVACSIFGVSLIFTYFSSTIYHLTVNSLLRKRYRMFDHISIYWLIAGSYTPFTLVSLQGAWGWSLFGVVIGLAVVGTIFKIVAVDKLEVLSTLTYVAMGWIIVVAVVPITDALPVHALLWLIAGGLLYTFGVIFFMMETVPFGHTIWHLFVLAAGFCHFWAVYWYVAGVKIH